MCVCVTLCGYMMHVHADIYVLCVRMSVMYMCARVYVCVCAYMCVSMCVRVYTYMYVHLCVYPVVLCRAEAGRVLRPNPEVLSNH